MRVLTFVLLLLPVASGAAADIVAGPEFAVGEMVLGVRAGEVGKPAMATDGDRTLLAFGANPNGAVGLYTQFLDRDGHPAGDPQLLDGPGTRVVVGAVWSGGRYVVFFWDRDELLLFAAFVNANGHSYGTPRAIARMNPPQSIVVRGDEIVLATSDSLVRLRSDATVIQKIALPYVYARALAAGPRSIGVLSLDKEAITLRTLDRSSLSPPVSVTPRTILGGYATRSALAWTGSEYVAVWSDCFNGTTCTAWMTRFDERGRSLGETREIGEVREPTYGHGLTLTALGDNTIFVTIDGGTYPNFRTIGRRFRAGIEVQDEISVIPAPPMAVSLNAHGQLFMVNSELFLSALPAHGVFPFRPELRPVVISPVHEQLWSAASTPTQVAVLRSRSIGGEPLKVIASVMTHDGALVYELEVDGWTASIASNGRDFYLLWSDENKSYLSDDELFVQRVAPGTAPVPVTEPGWYARLGLARHNSSIVITWHDGKHAYMRTIDDSGLQPGRALLGDPNINVWTPHFVSAGDELLLMWYESPWWQSKTITSGGWSVGEPVALSYEFGRPRCAWNGIAVGCTFESRYDLGYTFALRDSSGKFHVTTRINKPNPFVDFSALPSVRAMGDRYVVLRLTDEGHFVTVFDRNGKIADVLELRESGSPRESGVLVPLTDDKAIAFYARDLYTPPFIATQRVFGRVIEIRHAND